MRDLAVGSVLGRYELVLRIAKGGMGEVWAARSHGSRGFQKLVAIKTLLPELSQDPNFEQMFLDEASLAARLKHPNVVEVIDLGDEDQILYQVMEWVDGASLWAVMRAAAKRKEKALPLAVAAGIIHQVCAGLHSAHELKDPDGHLLGLVHRDVSPQNVLITPEGVAKVVDFGVARFTGRAGAATQVGELRGKVPYMAPEHIRMEEIDRRADVFALGLVLYQLLSGAHPFLGDSDAITLARIASELPATPLRTRMPDVSEELSAILDDALAKAPADRIATAALLMQRIERAVPGAGTASSRELVAEYCQGLGRAYFPARADELRDALRRLDDPSSSGRLSIASFPSLGSSPPSQREPPGSGPPSQQEPPVTLPSTTLPSTTTGSVAAPDELVGVPREGAPPQRRGWMVAGGAAAVVGSLVAVSFLRRPGPPHASGTAPPAPTVSIAAAPPVKPSAAASAAPISPASASPEASAAPIPPASASAEASAAPLASGSAKPRKPGKMPVKPGEFTPGGL